MKKRNVLFMPKYHDVARSYNLPFSYYFGANVTVVCYRLMEEGINVGRRSVGTTHIHTESSS